MCHARPWRCGPPHVDALRPGTRTLSHVAGYMHTSATLTGQGEAVRLAGSQIMASAFPLLGVPALLGRAFESSEESPGADAVVVLSHTAWQRYFNSDPAIVGRIAALDGRGRTIVGVMPASFAFPDEHVRYWILYVPLDPKGGISFSLTTIARLARRRLACRRPRTRSTPFCTAWTRESRADSRSPACRTSSWPR